MRIESPRSQPDGSWTVAIHGAAASVLVKAFDPDPHLKETAVLWSPTSTDLHEA
ncbi:hypothetical protein GCM10023196_049250 [Actinoallomurus vinaceus]|uniref:DUF397 domain-containing protein n=1 Tax=Actinoallomurus vinaceus TaxID=1080074 RepID=A0ABP8UFF8_9ACTN